MSQAPLADPLADLYQGAPNLTRIADLSRRRTVTALDRRRGITVAVLNLDRPDLVIPLLEAVPRISAALEDRGLGFELILGDTGSTDARTLAALEAERAGVIVVRDLEYQFSRSNNDICDGRVSYDRLLLLNNDVHLRSAEPLLELDAAMDRDASVGIVGAVLDFPNGTLQHAGVDLVRTGPMRGMPIHLGSRGPWTHAQGRSWRAMATTGAALMIRTDLWEALDGLDEAYARECQDVDLCLKAARLGYQTRVVDCGPLVHEENGTRPTGEEDWADRRLFLRRWSSFLEVSFL